MSSNIRIVQPVGYQQAVEFYSPVYATREEKNSSGPDLRSTIYWNPNVQVDRSGIAEVSFYAADPSTHYGIVLEGVSSQGHLINSFQKTVEITE
ncbi:MAG: hypothetical protein LUE93_16505 [Bacteroides sp.]|nr:hypothetical protein [Bacteroides sp.]